MSSNFFGDVVVAQWQADHTSIDGESWLYPTAPAGDFYSDSGKRTLFQYLKGTGYVAERASRWTSGPGSALNGLDYNSTLSTPTNNSDRAEWVGGVLSFIPFAAQGAGLFAAASAVAPTGEVVGSSLIPSSVTFDSFASGLAEDAMMSQSAFEASNLSAGLSASGAPLSQSINWGLQALSGIPDVAAPPLTYTPPPNLPGSPGAPGAQTLTKALSPLASKLFSSPATTRPNLAAPLATPGGYNLAPLDLSGLYDYTQPVQLGGGPSVQAFGDNGMVIILAVVVLVGLIAATSKAKL